MPDPTLIFIYTTTILVSYFVWNTIRQGVTK